MQDIIFRCCVSRTKGDRCLVLENGTIVDEMYQCTKSGRLLANVWSMISTMVISIQIQPQNDFDPIQLQNDDFHPIQLQNYLNFCDNNGDFDPIHDFDS